MIEQEDGQFRQAGVDGIQVSDSREVLAQGEKQRTIGFLEVGRAVSQAGVLDGAWDVK